MKTCSECLEIPPTDEIQVCNQPKMAFKKSIRKALFAALVEGEEDYIETPNLLSKINLYFT